MPARDRGKWARHTYIGPLQDSGVASLCQTFLTDSSSSFLFACFYKFGFSLIIQYVLFFRRCPSEVKVMVARSLLFSPPSTVCDIWKAPFVLSELKSPEASPSPPPPPQPRSFVMSGVGREGEGEGAGAGEWMWKPFSNLVMR